LSAVLTRALLLVAALAAIAWLVIGLIAADRLTGAQEVAQQLRKVPVAPERVRASLAALRDGHLLMPDGEFLLAEVELLAAAGRGAEADAVARRLIALEPESDRAWFLAYLTGTPEERGRALRRLAELNPWAADAFR
jgi:hypothetical protein